MSGDHSHQKQETGTELFKEWKRGDAFLGVETAVSCEHEAATSGNEKWPWKRMWP
eukprot:c4516_g1_i1 orf=78-242(-)